MLQENTSTQNMSDELIVLKANSQMYRDLFT